MKHMLLAFAAGLLSATAFSRTVSDFHSGWTFAREDGKFAPVTLPHDWAIAGPFDPAAKGGTGKLPWKGAGVYRRVISLPEKPKGRVFFEFDGVMGHSTCYVNGQPCGTGEYGYLGFRADATPYLMAGSNTVEVKCDTRLHHSRWYPGAGIYRDVRLVETDDLYLDADELRLSTEDVMTDKAKLSVDGAVTSRRAAGAKVEVVATLRDAEGKVVAEADDTVTVDGYADAEFSIELKAANPHLWELCDGAYLYTLEIVAKGEGATDSLVRKVGFREFRFDKDDGFILNGRRVQLNGVDLHSDLGPLGMAFSKDAMRRQLAVMRDMGANALRTSHNPPAPQVLDLCDEMGIFVWDEAFDKWNSTSGRSDEPLEEFVIRQLEAFVRRDRNHPCVFVWSIGNEISPGKAAPPGQDEWAGNVSHGTSVERCARFRHAVRRLDDTRPVGIGSCFAERVVNRGDYLPLDITGWNYRAMYRCEHAKNPDKPVLYTESASALSEYGFYGEVLPTNKTDYAWNSMEVTSYDYNAARWSDIPDWEFYRMEVDRYCGGEFVWTGIDYLGEPTPYGSKEGPGKRTVDDSRSSYFGICDLCAFPKDRFYLYRAHWNREAFTLHLAPEHWNFPSLAGKKLPAVFAYTSADEAELFLNGRSLGRRTKAKDLVPDEKDYYSVLPRYRLIWKDVPYEPGELKAVAYGKDGAVLGTKVLRTAGAAAKVVLTPERVYGSLCVVRVTLADKDGVFVPNDRRRVRFAIEGGEILAVGNSNPRSYASFKDVSSHPLHYGRAGVYVRLTPGKAVRLTASADGVAPATCTLPANAALNLCAQPAVDIDRLCPPRPETAARFRAGAYPAAACPYREAAKKAYRYMTGLPAMTVLVETGKPNQKYQHNAYVSKTHAAHVEAMLDWAKLEPQRRETAMRFAKASAEFLLKELESQDAPLAFWPPTYGRQPLEFDPKTDGPYRKPSMIGNEPEGAVKYRGEVMLLYPAAVGIAFVDYWRAAKDERFLAAARGIAGTYLKTRRADGSWPLKMKLATGEPIGENTLVPNYPLNLFEKLHEATDDPKWRTAADACFAWLEAHPLTDWNWDGQFEDIKPEKPYRNPTKHNAVDTMLYMLKRFPGDKARLETCRRILEFCEKRFVVWEAPENGEKWPAPSVLEQYSCFTPIDASAAKMIRAYVAMYRAEGRCEDFAKARALADTITRVQQPNGRIPTFWHGLNRNSAGLSIERYDWLNCMAAAAHALVLADELGNLPAAAAQAAEMRPSATRSAEEAPQT